MCPVFRGTFKMNKIALLMRTKTIQTKFRNCFDSSRMWCAAEKNIFCKPQNRMQKENGDKL